MYLLKELEEDARYELRVSYPATRPGRVKVRLLNAEDLTAADFVDDDDDDVHEEQWRRRGNGLRKLLEVEKIAFRVRNDFKKARFMPNEEKEEEEEEEVLREKAKRRRQRKQQQQQ